MRKFPFVSIVTVDKVLKQRLLAAIDLAQNEKNRYASNNVENKDAILQSIDENLRKAEIFANEKQFDKGWSCLLLAERDMIMVMLSAQKAIKANSLRIE